MQAFEGTLLNLIIKQKHEELKINENILINIENKLNEHLSEEEKEQIKFNENIIITGTQKQQDETHKEKFKKLQNKLNKELNIKCNNNWFVNKTNKTFPDDVTWLLSLGDKHCLPTSRTEFPLFKYIADAEDIIQTTTDKEQQEMSRTKLTTMLETHTNRMRENNRDKYMMRTVERTQKFLKQNKDILILNADKGNVTVAMNKTDYQERMSNILSDMMTYQRINKDPTSNLQKENNKIIEELFNNKCISLIEKKRLKTDVATAPRIYGLPKIHKEGFPLRPICSSINSPSIKLCKYIVNILKNLTKNSIYNVKDSVQFRNKIKNLTINDNERMISFDVVSLFPSIPVELGLKIIDERWDEIKQYTNMEKNMFLKIVQFCIKDNRYFKYEDKIYKQKSGLPMGSPASPILADLVMESLLNTTIDSLPIKPKILTKYVDDLFLIIREDAIQQTLTTLNGFNRKIQFTVEEENNGKISYLDTM
ncbi:putative leucine-rich repeat-containing protein DDB_G0290503, partial [Musca vetustissima]|uniref:putative leucine-rich repeat-containing protein DDB_G0290503 n=1 Tax=Musca vetustissima TaxID=27455 RepID=UPI002AB7711C